MSAVGEHVADDAFLDDWRFDDWLDGNEHEGPLLAPPVALAASAGSKVRRTKARATTKRKGKSTCERRRHEIALLRLQASELEATVELLAERLRQGFPADREEQSFAAIQQRARERDQFEKMQQATQENARLQLLVRVQRKRTKDLQRILKKRVACATLVEYSLLRPARCLELGESADDFDVYAKLLVSTDAMKAELDGVVRVLLTRVPDHGNGSFVDAQVAKIGLQQSVGVHMIASEEVPFPQERTFNALVRCLGEDSDTSREYMAENFGVLPGLVMDKRHVRWGAAAESSTFRIRRVRRTLALDNGASAILVIACIDPVDATFGEPTSRGFSVEERQWKIVRQRQPCGDPAVVSTLVQTYSTMAPNVLKPEYTSHWEKSLVSTVIPAWTKASVSQHQRLENLLIDGAKR